MTARPLEFRAWDSRNKTWLYMTIKPGIGIDYKYGNPPSLLDFFAKVDMDSIGPWQQFTGVLDCEEKKIWEGDILMQDEEDWNTSVVEYGVQQIDAFDVMGFSFYSFQGKEKGDRLSSEYKVIGNTTENPELL